MIARRSLLLLLALLTACAGVAPPPTRIALPMLRLLPSELGRELSLVQRLSVRRLDAPDAAPHSVEVLLEADAQSLRLAGFALSRRVLTMVWDGHELQVTRHPLLPAEVDTERMLRDLCLVFWPVAAVRAQLPAGWALDEESTGRRLSWQGETLLTVTYAGALDGIGLVELVNKAEGYALRIESKVQA